MLTIVAFLVALGLLIAVHEYGHYRVAVACGVKVLRFSVGFGKTLVSYKPKRQRPGQDTEFVIGAFPLGGYVKMLDEREGDVAACERHLAFNTQPLAKRAAIVAAGPIANLLLAVLLYAVVSWHGVQEPKAVIAPPAAGSIAARAGLQGGDFITAAGFSGNDVEPVRSFEDLRWLLTRGALDGRDVRVAVSRKPGSEATQEVLLPLSGLDTRLVDADLYRKIGIASPWMQPVVGEVVQGGAAQRAGLRSGDLVVSIDGAPVQDGMQVYERVRASGASGKAAEQVWQVRRAGGLVELRMTPAVVKEGDVSFGRIGAVVQRPPEMVLVRHGPLEGLWNGVQRTWEMSEVTVRMLGRMVIGDASLKNLSGPLTIAEYAGKSAAFGLTQYLIFLAAISVSLGVLNLLPIPVLDGGHLMYYLWEAVTGRGISDAWMERLQRGGVAVLLVMMSIALFNDFSRHITRLFG
jgi:regulator of sigma E protease